MPPTHKDTKFSPKLFGESKISEAKFGPEPSGGVLVAGNFSYLF
jgi:hypothetical protein